MDNELREINEMFEALQVIANYGYWQATQDCGSDVDESCKGTCKHYQVCKANETINKLLESFERGKND